MKEKFIKQAKGITLIALVITIIVLLILAGVAISMLSGENGILSRASEAKEKTEEAQKEEETGLASMELETYFLTNNLKYKCAYGYITGLTVKEGYVVDTVEELKNVLPSGYELKAIDGTENFTATNSNGEYIVTTGLQIQKDGKEVARTVVFGDSNCNGHLDMSDSALIMNFVNNWVDFETDAQIIASDINKDNKINFHDSASSSDVFVEDLTLDQSVYAPNPKKILVEDDNYINTYIKEQYIEEIKKKMEGTIYTGELKKSGNYNISGATTETTVEEILTILPENAKIKRSNETLNNTDTLQNSDNIVCIYDDREVSIGYIRIK